MTVLLPVPGYAAKLIQDVEIRKMDMVHRLLIIGNAQTKE